MQGIVSDAAIQAMLGGNGHSPTDIASNGAVARAMLVDSGAPVQARLERLLRLAARIHDAARRECLAIEQSSLQALAKLLGVPLLRDGAETVRASEVESE